MASLIYRKAMRCLIVSILFIVTPTIAATPAVAVIYPEVRAPYNRIFEDIADGVEEKVGKGVKRYPLAKEFSSQALNEWINEHRIEACVALGKRGEKAVGEFKRDMPVVLSGILKSTSPTYPSISFTASPDRLFAELKEQMSNIEQVVVVYHPDKTGWLVKQAQEDAAGHNLELVRYPSLNLSESAKIYRKIFGQVDHKTTAIWLLPDPVSVDRKALLSFILDKSWVQNVVMFSSSPEQVSKGVLFAMYPDNLKLGRSLGDMVLDELSGGANLNGLILAKDLKTAFNKRTAEHLGIRFSSNDLRKYDAVYPSE